MHTRSHQSRESDGDDSESNVTMSQETLSNFITAMQNSQAQFCRELLREVRSSTPLSPNISMNTSVNSSGNFAKCTIKYGGRCDESLENFIDAILSYKDCVNMSDENAFRGLAMLLEGPAAVWWQGVKPSTTSWTETLSRLRSAFGDHDPPYRIYKKLFTLQQGEEHTDLFIAKTRALLGKFSRRTFGENSTRHGLWTTRPPHTEKARERQCNRFHYITIDIHYFGTVFTLCNRSKR